MRLHSLKKAGLDFTQLPTAFCLISTVLGRCTSCISLVQAFCFCFSTAELGRFFRIMLKKEYLLSHSPMLCSLLCHLSFIPYYMLSTNQINLYNGTFFFAGIYPLSMSSVHYNKTMRGGMVKQSQQSYWQGAEYSCRISRWIATAAYTQQDTISFYTTVAIFGRVLRMVCMGHLSSDLK